ncbi:MAG: 30S ribosomal protein S3 [Phycisphaerae bacterium]|jgi:small subunit ribosomal protein S3
MGQKTSPIGFRTGIRLDWQSTWFARKQNFGDFLVEDCKIRKFVEKRYNGVPYSAVARTEIARTPSEVKITLHTARPGMVIGPKGAEIDKVRGEIEALINRKVSVNVVEVKDASFNAKLVADAIAQQLSRRASFRRVLKMQCEQVMNAGALGVKLMVSGRLGGAEIARTESTKLGSIPLQTIDANVDYATALAHTTYGVIGVKVWIYRGKFGEEVQAQPQQRRFQKGGKRAPRRGDKAERAPRNG